MTGRGKKGEEIAVQDASPNGRVVYDAQSILKSAAAQRHLATLAKRAKNRAEMASTDAGDASKPKAAG